MRSAQEHKEYSAQRRSSRQCSVSRTKAKRFVLTARTFRNRCLSRKGYFHPDKADILAKGVGKATLLRQGYWAISRFSAIPSKSNTNFIRVHEKSTTFLMNTMNLVSLGHRSALLALTSRALGLLVGNDFGRVTRHRALLTDIDTALKLGGT